MKNENASRKKSLGNEIFQLGIMLLIVFFLRSSVFGIYQVPTGSMLPTIKLGDRVFANLLAYGLMLPLTESQIVSWSAPVRGDIVMFKSPNDNVTLVKRVVGIAGDRVSFTNGKITINGEVAEETRVSDTSILNDMGRTYPSIELYIEKAKDTPPHHVLRDMSPLGRTNADVRTYEVPAGQLFCIGDNRDDSMDGRSWGFINTKDVYGRGEFVFYSVKPSEDFLPDLRTDRFFSKLDRL
jgi:signal peptidase I